MKAKYYDPLFYISSEKMPFTIRMETVLKDEIKYDCLSYAVEMAMKRYPHFAVKVVEDNEEYITIHNDKPIVVYEGPDVLPLGGSEVNDHIFAVSYYKNEIRFYVSHVFTDGNGFCPLVKTVLYYYMCQRYGRAMDSTGINLADDALFPDEVDNPYPEELMKNAMPIYEKKVGKYFRLSDGPYVNDHNPTVYRCSIREDELMNFNHDNDGSPCIALSVLMSKAIWALHPDIKDDLVSAISFNLRPGLKNKNNYRMLCSALFLDYQDYMRDFDVSKLCTCSRGMIMIQSQPENVLHYAQKRKERFEALENIPDLKTKKEIIGKKALEDSINNTFSVSYTGKLEFGEIGQYIESISPLTDGSTYDTIFMEIFSINGAFNISFLQGFSSDIYYRAFLKQLEKNGLHYEEGKSSPLIVPKMSFENN